VSTPGRRRPKSARSVAPTLTEPLEGSVRLQKVLARAGVSSRRGGEALITAGRVTVNEKVVTELGARVDPGVDQIAVDGRVIQLEPPVYLVMNKPDGVVCSAEPKVDERGRPTVVSLVRGIAERVYPVGRLDFHTRGVLLLTNDGDLAARLTHPRHKVPKTYHAKFQGQLGPPELESLSLGVTLEDGTRTAPLAEISVIKDTQTNSWVQLTVTQGLYRQVRRMGDAIGHPVLKLIRVAFAGVDANGLDDGEWRHLREDEVALLRAQAAPKAAPKAAAPKAAPKAAAPKAAARKGPAAPREGSGKPRS
jgi:23S rRNA pseudouridine2605 synthase